MTIAIKTGDKISIKFLKVKEIYENYSIRLVPTKREIKISLNETIVANVKEFNLFTDVGSLKVGDIVSIEKISLKGIQDSDNIIEDGV